MGKLVFSDKPIWVLLKSLGLNINISNPTWSLRASGFPQVPRIWGASSPFSLTFPHFCPPRIHVSYWFRVLHCCVSATGSIPIRAKGWNSETDPDSFLDPQCRAHICSWVAPKERMEPRFYLAATEWGGRSWISGDHGLWLVTPGGWVIPYFTSFSAINWDDSENRPKTATACYS